jgi:hypothetical protein
MNLKDINSSMLFITGRRLPKAIFLRSVAPARTLLSLNQGNTLKDSFASRHYLQKTITTKNLFL